MPRAVIARYYLVIGALAAIGVACAGYVLAHEGSGLPNPWANVYDVRAEFTAADGVVAGIGQPVNVAGVGVGSIVAAKLDRSGNALVTIEIQRSQLPHVYANASAALQPITPLDDMQIDLTPGGPPAPALRDGATLGVAQTSSPVQLSDILAALDGDTRTYLTSLISSFDQGTAGRSQDMRRALLELGPTTAQLHRVTDALSQRRTELAQLVHNLAQVTLAATRDRQLASVVQAGNQTLQAVAHQNIPLRHAIAALPGTLRSARTSLGYVATFANELTPTEAALLPPVRRLPATLAALRPFARGTASMLSSELRPFVRQVQPLVRNLAAATPTLTALTPEVTSIFQVLNYLLNVLAYNPNNEVNGSRDEGGLFWFDWFAHNFNSMFSTADAMGTIGRASFVDSCQNETSLIGTEVTAIVGAAIGLSTICPK